MDDKSFLLKDTNSDCINKSKPILSYILFIGDISNKIARKG
jgi:hypothetical protein